MGNLANNHNERPLARSLKKSTGFTLVELLLSVALAGIVSASIYSLYSSQQKSFAAQDELAQLQARMRTALYFLERDISTAGCDPTGNANAGIVAAEAHMIRVTEDRNANGDASEYNEDIAYYIGTVSGVKKLYRESPPGNKQPIAEHMEALDFVYLDKDGYVLPTPVSDTKKIRGVQISLLGRTAKPVSNIADQKTYSNQQGTVIFGPANDGHKRLLLTTEVFCRNLSFQ